MDKSNEMIPSQAQFNQVIFGKTWVLLQAKTKCEMNATRVKFFVTGFEGGEALRQERPSTCKN